MRYYLIVYIFALFTTLSFAQNPCANDIQRPTFTGCYDTIFVNSDPDTCGVIVKWVSPLAIDNCDTSLTIDSTRAIGSFFPVGSTKVIYNATDDAGNLGICQFVIKVTDKTPPKLTCLNDTIVYLPSNGCTVVVNWKVPPGMDNCSSVFATTSSFPNGSQIGKGIKNVTFTSKDVFGNAATCTMKITVKDSIAPVSTNCPPPIVVRTTGAIVSDPNRFILFANATTSCDSVRISFKNPIFTDNCGVDTVYNKGLFSGTNFGIGTNEIKFEAKDSSGNIGTCTFNINVIYGRYTGSVTATFLNPSRACEGSNLQLTSFRDSMTAYKWSGPNGFKSDSANPLIINTSILNSGVYRVILYKTGECPLESSITVVLNPRPKFTISATYDCRNDSLILTSTITNNVNVSAYQWNGPRTFTSALKDFRGKDTIPSANDTYRLLVRTTSLCVDTLNVKLKYLKLPLDTIIASKDSICLGDITTLIARGTNAINYNWYSNRLVNGIIKQSNDSIVINPKTTGVFTYNVYQTRKTCTSDTLSKDIVVNILPIKGVFASPFQCIEDTSIIILSDSSGANKWKWTGPNNFKDTLQTIKLDSLKNTKNGIYYLTATNQFGCSKKDTFDVNYTLKTNLKVSGRLDYCGGETIQLSADTIPKATYSWTGPGNLKDTSPNIIITNAKTTNAGLYTLTVIDSNGCSRIITKNISVLNFIDAINDLGSINTKADSIKLNIGLNDSILNNSLIYSFISSPVFGTVGAIDSGKIVYKLKNKTDIGTDIFKYKICYKACPLVCDSATIQITIVKDTVVSPPKPCAFIPNVITPNNDGLNDNFYIPCLDGNNDYPSNEIIILNEWGTVVYKALPYKNDWKGTFNAVPLPDGVYFYVFKTSALDPGVKGYITILK
jgi:gliding motility-associated-like protein